MKDTIKRFMANSLAGCLPTTTSYVGPKRILKTVVALLSVLAAFACPSNAQQPVPGTRGVAEVHTVVNFTELARREAAAPPPRLERRVAPFMRMPPPPPVPLGIAMPKAAPTPAAPAVPSTPLAPSPAPAANFQALGDNDMAIPPDTQGAVGPNHLMVALNTQVRIQDRTGVAISTVALDFFWSSTGATGVFDPKLAYDPFNNRWIFTCASNANSAASSLLIGATRTSDPTGTWDLFRVDVDATNAVWGDYPSLGFNKDWAVVTLNMFTVVPNIANSQFARENIYVFNKAMLYAGPAASATFTLFTDTVGTQAPALTYDKTLPMMFLVANFNGNSMGSGFLRLSTITGTVGMEMYTAQASFVSTPNPWDFAPPGFADFAPQQGTNQKIQNNDSRILSAVFRNGFIWASQSVFVPAGGSPTRTAAQWWQFKPDGTVQQFGRVDDPSGVLFFAFPFLSVNAQNDALLGYSSFSGTQFASANYSVRFASDPLNTLRSDALLKAGEATYFKTFGGTENRWGDYSNTVVDPVNDLDMWTIQEYASSPNFPNGDNRWGTWWGKITVPKKRRAQLVSQ